MARGKVNVKNVMKKIATSKRFQKKIDVAVQKKIDEAHKQLARDFDSHPITAEIEAGASSNNSSGTLGGYGNLFSFIGFNSGSNPISPLRALIQQAATIRRGRILSDRKGIKLSFKVNLPSQAQINAVTPMPWEGGSWAEAMENGMSNFSYYMYKRFGEGRSGRGFQVDHNLRNAIFKPKAYITQILNNFKQNVRNIK
jgi:hypothetical protein